MLRLRVQTLVATFFLLPPSFCMEILHGRACHCSTGVARPFFAQMEAGVAWGPAFSLGARFKLFDFLISSARSDG